MQPLPPLGLDALGREWTAKLKDITGLLNQWSSVIYAVCWLMLRFAICLHTLWLSCIHVALWQGTNSNTRSRVTSFPQIVMMQEERQQLYLSKAKRASELNRETLGEGWNKALVTDKQPDVAGGCVGYQALTPAPPSTRSSPPCSSFCRPSSLSSTAHTALLDVLVCPFSETVHISEINKYVNRIHLGQISFLFWGLYIDICGKC